jgi:MOSC domain-containing protein YiiM
MRILAVCVSMPKLVQYRRKEFLTGIYKQPVLDPRFVSKTNIDGDAQADLSVHGGIDKAVYAFPSEHYQFYETLLNRGHFEFGQFGENLTTEGLLETEVHIGDQYQINDVVFEVSQPRSPCFKFGMKMGTAAAVKACFNSCKTGFYLRVLHEGSIQSGDTIERLFANDSAPSIYETHRLYYFAKRDVSGLKRALRTAALSQVWKDEFESRLRELDPGNRNSLPGLQPR